jgi:parallel beta-helix repeat protein
MYTFLGENFHDMKIIKICLYFLAWLLIHILCTPGILHADTTTNYVSLTGTHVYPYTNWVTAATNIQDAVDAGVSNVILVAPGTYDNQDISISAKTLIGAGYKSTIVSGNSLSMYSSYIDGFTISDYRDNFSLSMWGGTIQNCKVKNVNKFYFGYGSGIIENCIFTENNYGIYVEMSEELIIRNCLIYNNNNVGIDIVLGAIDGGATIENCTIVSNGCGIYYFGGTFPPPDGVDIYNSIIYYNDVNITSPYHKISCLQNSCSIYDEYISVERNVITNEPQFVNAAGNDFHLAASSPCIDTGANLDWMPGTTDLDGNPRIWNGTVDMGCYEAAPSLVCNMTADRTAGMPPAEITFNATVYGSNIADSYYQWDFEHDGIYDLEGYNLADVTHAYTQTGDYSVAVHVRNSCR